MEKLSSNPKDLAVTDLQLLVSLGMRQGIDLTAFLTKTDDNGHELSFSPTKDIRMTAKFDEFGFTDGIILTYLRYKI